MKPLRGRGRGGPADASECRDTRIPPGSAIILSAEGNTASSPCYLSVGDATLARDLVALWTCLAALPSLLLLFPNSIGFGPQQ